MYIKVTDVRKMALRSLQIDYTWLPQKHTESTAAYTVFSALSTIFIVTGFDV